MNRWLVIILLMLSAACGPEYSGKTPPPIVDGIIDLTDWDFEKDGPVKLHGQWRFSWDNLLEPGDLSQAEIDALPLARTPAYWSQISAESEELTLSNQGSATRILEIHLPNSLLKTERLAIQTLPTQSAARWILSNRSFTPEAVHNQGQVSRSPSEELPWWTPVTINFPAGLDNNKFLWLQESNFHHHQGGSWAEIYLGLERQLTGMDASRLVFAAVTWGICFFCALYHFVLFAQYRRDWTMFWFGLLCTGFMLRTACTDFLVASLGVSESYIYYQLLIRAEYFSLPLIGFSFLGFFNTLYPWGRLSNVIAKLIASALAIECVFVSAVDVVSLTQMKWVTLGSMVFSSLASLVVLLRAYRLRLPDAEKFGFAWCLLLSAGVHDVLVGYNIIHSTYVMPFVFLVFIYLQAVFLSGRNALAQHQAAHLSQNLQAEVSAQTATLRAKTVEAQSATQEALTQKAQADALRLEAESLKTEAESHATQLAEIDSQKTHFFQNMSHELRTPLTLILNPLEEQSREQPDNADLQVALRNSRRLLRLVNQLLDFQKLSAGKQELELAPLDVVKFGRVCGDYFLSACSTKGVDFEIRSEGLSETFVHGNLDAMEKIVFNFLSNALKYTPADGKITLALHESNGLVRIDIQDTGPGISEEGQAKLFKVFSQVDESTTRAFEGTGLGLALTRELAEKMGGSVGVESKVGEGSTFYVELPLCEAPSQGESTELDFQVKDWLLDSVSADSEKKADEYPVSLTDGNGKTVLVVDDLPDMRELIASTLKKHGYVVVKTQDGREGLKAATMIRPHLIVSDWMMPEMSGPDMIAAIREDESLAGIPCILLTAKSDEESKLAGKEIGADAFLGKPFNAQELVSTVRNLIQLKSNEEKLRVAHEALKESSQRELRHAKDLVTQSEKLAQLGAMVSGIGHEIANPINLMNTSVKNAAGKVDDLREALEPLFGDDEESQALWRTYAQLFEEVRGFHADTALGGERLKDLSMALRTQSRMEVSATDGVDLNEVIKESMTLASGRTKAHAVSSALTELPALTCFRSKVGQVLTNLLANAADALSEKVERSKEAGGERHVGKIHVASQVSARDGVDGVMAIVSDNGDGVPESIREKIFEQFFTTKEAGVGTGLGLAMCVDIVREHGGHLDVRDDPELGGARFELWLPLERSDREAASG